MFDAGIEDSIRTARRTLQLCFLVALCEGVDLQAAGVAVAGIGAVYHPTVGELVMFFNASTYGLVLGAVVGGGLADRVGRKTVLIVSIVAFGLFSLSTPLARDMHSLAWARALTGLGLGGALPNLIALVAESAPDSRRNANVAAAYSAAPIGGALVSLLSFSIDPQHWRWIFVAGGIAPLLIVPVLAVALPESGAFLHAQAARTAGRNPAEQRLRASEFAQLFKAGRAMRTLLLWGGFFIALLMLYLLLNWLPTLLIHNGLSHLVASLAQVGFNAGGAMAALLTGRLLEGRGRGAVIIAISLALPVLLYTLAHAPADAVAIVFIVCLLGCAVLAGQAFYLTVAATSYPTRIRGLGVGAAIAAGRLGSVAGPMLGGALTGWGFTVPQLLVRLVPIAVLGGLFCVILAATAVRADAH